MLTNRIRAALVALLAAGSVAGVGLAVDSGPAHPAQAGTYCSVWLDGVLHCVYSDPGSKTHK
jgi:hypothetical protein